MSTVLIKNARIIDPARQRDATGNLFIDGGILQDPEGINQADTVINGERLICCPGLIDLYARLREPGQEKKASIASETRAALYGGITRLICSPDTDPAIDETATVELIHRRVDDAGYAAVYPLAALTQKLDGEQISELATLIGAGCIAATNANKPVSNTRVIRSIMEYAATFDIQLMFVAQDADLALNGVIHEGLASTRMGLIGIPVAAETVALSMLMELAWQTGARVHFTRISSARGVELIRNAKQHGLPITADTSINHLLLTDENTLGFNSLCHMNPPARSRADQESLRHALSDGTLDAICTDHAPHEPDAKLAPFPSTEPGISGLDMFLPLLLKVAQETSLSLSEIFRLSSTNPASIMRMEGGSLEVGKHADLILFSDSDTFVCDPESFHSQGKNSPYKGMELKGQVKAGFVEGRYFDLSNLHE